MSEVFVEFDALFSAEGRPYRARACGGEANDGLWHGWVEFVPIDGEGILSSQRETTQPNRIDAMYWATGLTTVYLEGALERALNPLALKAAEK